MSEDCELPGFITKRTVPLLQAWAVLQRPRVSALTDRLLLLLLLLAP